MRGIGEPDIKSTPLMVDGILYFTIPDHVFALDARTGLQLWQYDWVDKGGHLIGNRGVVCTATGSTSSRPMDGSCRSMPKPGRSGGERK